MSTTRIAGLVLAGAVLFTSVACADGGIGPEDDATALLGIAPLNGSADISVGTSVVATFDHPVGVGMEAFAALHEGALTGTEVEGVWTLSSDRTALAFQPDRALKPATTYVLHLGGGMTDDHGNHVNLGQHGLGMGGEWATASMMTGGMGMGAGNGHMLGSGWTHPSNGSYGMIFSFTTAAS